MTGPVGGLLLLGGLVGFIATLVVKVRLNKQHTWPTASGVVDESRVEYRSENFYPIVSYSYTYQDRGFRGKKIASFEITGNWRSTADRWVARYPEGSTVTVFVDPENPRNAVLEPEGDRKFLPIALFASATFIVIGGLYLFHA